MLSTRLRTFPQAIRIPLLSSRRGIKIRGSKAFIVTTIGLAVFTDIFLYGVIVPVIPFAFERRMHVNHNDVQMWVSKSLAVYSVGLIVGSIVFGYLADRMRNRRTSMLLGLVVLVAATIILCLTKSLALFMVGRVLQGLSAAVVWTVGLAVIADTADPNEVAYLMAYPGIGMNLGIFFGPLLGGIVYDRAGYYSVFYLCFALLVFDILLRLLMIERKNLPRKLRRFSESSNDHDETKHTGERDVELMQPETGEPTGSNESNSNGSVSGVSNMPNEHVNETTTEETQAQAREHYAPESAPGRLSSFILKLPPIFRLLTSWRVLTALFQSFALSWIMAALDATLTIHLNDIFGFNSLQASLMFLAVAVPAFAEPLAGKISDKFGPRFIVTFGLALTAPFLILLRLPQHDSTQQIVEFAALLAVAGLGLTCVFSPVLAELTAVTTEIEARSPGIFGPGKGFGQVYGLFNVAFSLGSMVGPFQAGAVVNGAGWGMMTLSIGIITLVTLIPTIMFTGGSIFRIRKDALARREQGPQYPLCES
uniref:ARAD1C11352p n=1 Tax=Blastobotrys adeninivorans TaxID=409370 RepID=A0A060SZU6_BLAAD